MVRDQRVELREQHDAAAASLGVTMSTRCPCSTSAAMDAAIEAVFPVPGGPTRT
jgi:hypothetical protein